MSHRAGGSRGPRSQPAKWRPRRMRRRASWHLGDAPRRRKGGPSWPTRVRRLLWSWRLWAVVTVWMLAVDRWWWATAAAALSLVSHIIHPRTEAPRLGLDHDFTVDSAEFFATMAGATGVPFVGGNGFTIHDNGDAFYPRMLGDVRAASASIAMEAYIYWEGEIGRTFADALAERARAGVRVMLLLDAVGSSDIGDEILAVLREGGCQVAWYNPLDWKNVSRFNNRTHRKSLIIDGVIAWTGGAGIADHWKGDARNEHEWRDQQVRIEGPAAQGLQSGFAHNWQEATGELISGEAYYPPAESRGPYALQVILSSPVTGASSVQILYYLGIVCARQRIRIANPYFVPDPVATQTLVEARRRGVDVTVMVSGRHNDNWLARQNSIRLYGPLLRAGVRILEYDRSMLHHKVMVVDGLFATVGTTNFDNRSFAHNEESNVCLLDTGLATQLEASFEHDIAACSEVTIEAWQRRGVVRRALEQVAALLEDQV